jgi:PAS domain S-box-containing protein
MSARRPQEAAGRARPQAGRIRHAPAPFHDPGGPSIEEALQRRDAVLEAVGYAAERFLKTRSWEEVTADVLSRLGEAAGVSRAYVFENRTDAGGNLLMDERFEWVALGIATTMEDPGNHGLPYLPDFARYVEVLGYGGAITTSLSDASSADEADLRSEDIKSTAFVPIFAGELWWGFVGFDDCFEEREWSRSELDALKAAAGILGAAIDRERAERAREEAEAQNRMLLEHVPAITYIETADVTAAPWAARTMYVNAHVETILGYSPEEMLENPDLWHSLIHPDDLGRVLAEDQRTNETGERYKIEYRIIARDGRVLWIHDEARLVVDEATGPALWHGVMVDITARKETEAGLREAEQKYRTLVEQIPAVTYMDVVPDDDPTDLTPTYISPQIETLLGYLPDEWIADPDMWDKVVHPEDVDRVNGESRAAFASGTPLSTEYRMIARDGRTVWMREEASLVRDENGAPEFWQGIYVDITGLKRAEEELNNALQREREASERLRVLDEMKNTFLQAVSHDLRTPLAAILGLAVTLERDDVQLDEPDVRDLAKRIAANSRKLDRMVADLLDLDRLTRGIIEPKLHPTDVGALVQHLVGETEMLGNRRLVVETESVVIPVDSAKVERIVENLLANTVRHTPAGSRVWVRVSPEDGGVLIAVEDEGPGVPEEFREAVFEPFRQGPGASNHSPGVGVGLSLVARFAELHGGRAWVEDRVGGGASFRVFLPAG